MPLVRVNESGKKWGWGSECTGGSEASPDPETRRRHRPLEGQTLLTAGSSLVHTGLHPVACEGLLQLEPGTEGSAIVLANVIPRCCRPLLYC